MKSERTVRLSQEWSLRGIGDFVRRARTLGKGMTLVNGKGFLGLLPLFMDLRPLDSMKLIAEGEDAKHAVDERIRLYFPSEEPSGDPPVNGGERHASRMD